MMREELNFDFLAFESSTESNGSNTELNPICERNGEKNNNTQFELGVDAYQIIKLEPNLQEDYDTEGEIIQYDDPAPQQLDSLGDEF
jgi:hypothetical protein